MTPMSISHFSFILALLEEETNSYLISSPIQALWLQVPQSPNILSHLMLQRGSIILAFKQKTKALQGVGYHPKVTETGFNPIYSMPSPEPVLQQYAAQNVNLFN